MQTFALSCDENAEKIVADGYSKMEDYMDKQITRYDFQGTVLVGDGEKVVFAKAYGYANEDAGIKNTLKTTFGIGSITKQFTAAAIMQLKEDGLLNVNDTLDKYFPVNPDAGKITIRNLLQMRSGIVDYVSEPEAFWLVEDAKKKVQNFLAEGDYIGFDEEEWSTYNLMDLKNGITVILLTNADKDTILSKNKGNTISGLGEMLDWVASH